MNKFVLAMALALPLTVLTEQRACAWGECYDLSGCFRIKICTAASLKLRCEPFCCKMPNCSPCGGGGCGYGGGCSECGNGCPPCFPGPWYQFWPYDGVSQIAPPYPGGCFPYEAHFQAPAPTGYPYWPNPQVMMANGQGQCAPQQAPYPAAGYQGYQGYPQGGYQQGYQPVGYHPQAPAYWYP